MATLYIRMANLHYDFYFSNYHFPKIQQLYFLHTPKINAGFFLIVCSGFRRPIPNVRTQNYGAEENVGHDNPVFGQTASESDYMEIEEFQRPVQQHDVGFRNPHFDPADHYQPLNNANGRPDNVYGRLNLTGVHSQSEV